MSVFGVSLTQTVVVSTRVTALVVARACRTLGISGLTIDILEELALSSKQTTIQNKEEATCMNHRNPTNDAILISLINCVTITRSEVYPVVEARLRNWFLYRGSGYEVYQGLQNDAKLLKSLL